MVNMKLIKYLAACEVNPSMWKTFIGKEIFKNNKSIGIISEVKDVGSEKQLIIGNGERVVLTKWLRQGVYDIKSVSINEDARNRLIKEIENIKIKINMLELNDSRNEVAINSILDELDVLNDQRKLCLQKFIVLLNRYYFSKRSKIYYNKCWKCKSGISSLTEKFCIYCGWYHCSKCSSCGCNIPYSNVTFNEYSMFLRSNLSANVIKGEIEDIDEKIRNITSKYDELQSISYKNNMILHDYNEKLMKIKGLINY